MQTIQMKNEIYFALIGLLFLIATSSVNAEGDISLVYQDKKLTISASDITLKDLLRQVSEITRTEIFLFDEVFSGTIDAKFSEHTIEEVLKSLLKGYSYAIVYAAHSDAYGLYSMLTPRRQRVATEPYNFHKTAGINDSSLHSEYSLEHERMLISKIQSLQERIDSGQSDRTFEKWAAVRGAQFVVNDRDRLAHYKRQLAELRAGEDR